MLRDLFSLFPAYAGVIPVNRISRKYRESFPRIRGGDPLFNRLCNLSLGFSPHTRG